MMRPSGTLPPAGIALLAALAIFWGANWPAMKLGLREVDPWTFRTLCLVTGGLGLLGIARTGGQPLGIARDDRGPLVVVTLFNIVAWHMLTAYGLRLVNAGRAVMIAYTMPLWAVLLGRIVLREPLSRARIAGLLLGLGGLGVLIAPEWYSLWAAPIGTLLMLGAAVSWAVGTVLVKRFRWTMPTVLLTGWQLTLGAVPVLAGQLLFERLPSPGSLSLQAAIGTAYAAVVGVLFCHYAWFRVVRLLPAGIAAVGTLGIPVVGVLSSGLVLGEPVGIRELAALALILPALGIVLWGPGPRQ